MGSGWTEWGAGAVKANRSVSVLTAVFVLSKGGVLGWRS